MRIGIGIGLQFNKSAGGNSAEALAWKARIEANGGTISQALLDIFDTNFFIPAKANGNILTELDRLNIYCGLVGFEIAARTNIIKSSHYVTPVSSPTFDQFGYKTSGTSYLNLNYNPSTQGVKLVQNSANMGFVVKAPQFNANKFPMGCQNAAETQILRIRRVSGGANTYINRDSSTSSTSVSVSAQSENTFIAGIRTASNAESIWINGTQTVGSTNASSVRPNQNVFELTINNNGTPQGNYDDNSHLASWCGSSALDYAAFRTILINLFTALGV